MNTNDMIALAIAVAVQNSKTGTCACCGQRAVTPFTLPTGDKICVRCADAN